MTGQTYRDFDCSKVCQSCGELFFRDKRNTWAHWHKARFCSRSCFGAFNAARKVAMRPDRETAFRRWFAEGDGCWEWQGAIDRDGYGIFSFAGTTSRAARVALTFDGRDPGDAFACHHCDNPRCVRPSHLFVGTNQENMQDMVAKGRNPDRRRGKNPNWKGGSSGRLLP